MNTIAEIEKAIENLTPMQVEELAGWLEEFRKRRVDSSCVETWLRQARGSALPGKTTASIMDLSRGDE
ncbi:MAG: hypothetical protein KF851_19725 [Pirellulaceae bacterium]|nr:hypothetical protein [Pirellulaceae bacterium]